MDALARSAALAGLRQAIADKRLGRLATQVGYDKSTLSLVANDKYPADPARVLTRVAEVLDGVDCPHLGEQLSHERCTVYQTRLMPTSDPDALAHWAACRGCVHYHGELR